jgi:hypothetical protein
MAGGRHYSEYQKGVIKRYYENRETIMTQKLGDLVGDLYMCTDKKKADRLWDRVEKALTNAGVHKHLVGVIVRERSVARLAEVVGDIF